MKFMGCTISTGMEEEFDGLEQLCEDFDKLHLSDSENRTLCSLAIKLEDALSGDKGIEAKKSALSELKEFMQKAVHKVKN